MSVLIYFPIYHLFFYGTGINLIYVFYFFNITFTFQLGNQIFLTFSTLTQTEFA